MTYERTKSKRVDAIIWTGTNIKLIKEFVSDENVSLKFEPDKVTQLTQLSILDYKNNICYKAKWGDYIIYDYDEERYYIRSKDKFENEYSEYNSLHSSDNDTENKWEPYININFVVAQKAMNSAGICGYNVKDSTGFIKFYSAEDFIKKFTHLQDYMADNIKIDIKEGN